jgi:CheY-like chemotaxis protein/HPt (histidine-containing phosphotransfer) domain-containing protein
VAVAANGAEAVRLASWQAFDLVLMDVQMPEMDGYQATRELRRAGYARPIVALTADTRPETRQACLDAGCTEFLTKPVERKRLLAACRRFISADPDLGAAEGAPLRSVLAGDPRIARVLDGFISRLPQRVKQFEECVASGDVAGLKHAVHNLKGAGAGYGFEPLSESATRVEEALRTHKSLEAVRGQIDELIGLIRRVEGYGEPRKTTSPQLVPA